MCIVGVIPCHRMTLTTSSRLWIRAFLPAAKPSGITAMEIFLVLIYVGDMVMLLRTRPPPSRDDAPPSLHNPTPKGEWKIMWTLEPAGHPIRCTPYYAPCLRVTRSSGYPGYGP